MRNMFATVPKNEESTFTQMAHFWTLSERANLSQCHNFDQVQETKLGPKRPFTLIALLTPASLLRARAFIRK
jgi:hypothetical protein